MATRSEPSSQAARLWAVSEGRGTGQRADNGVAHWRPRNFLLSHFVFLLSLFVLLSSHFAFCAAFGTNLFYCCRAGTADACPAQPTDPESSDSEGLVGVANLASAVSVHEHSTASSTFASRNSVC
eukprot:scaffold2741_cov134-Isochrysis_galbana.AAC.13